MNGRSWGTDGELDASRLAARFIDEPELVKPLLHTTAFVQDRIALDADDVLSAQYAGDTIIAAAR